MEENEAGIKGYIALVLAVLFFLGYLQKPRVHCTYWILQRYLVKQT